MPNDAKRTTIELHLPLALMERIRAIEALTGATDESIVRESLRVYFAARSVVLEA